tara:strand:+ start:7690 stop:7938 length:249 start_codon:yes stop_codon:yes gene_type:complete
VLRCIRKWFNRQILLSVVPEIRTHAGRKQYARLRAKARNLAIYNGKMTASTRGIGYRTVFASKADERAYYKAVREKSRKRTK